MDNLEKAYIRTYTGRKFNLLNPSLDDIDIADIAHAQSQLCRWTGHCRFHYSIAQHAWYCSFIGPEEQALGRLLHDASESYIGDMNRPLKHFTDAGHAYQKVESKLQGLIYTKYGLPAEDLPSVKPADEAMLYAEMDQLFYIEKNFESADWTNNNPYGRSKSADVKITQWHPELAETMFLSRFNQLTRGKI